MRRNTDYPFADERITLGRFAPRGARGAAAVGLAVLAIAALAGWLERDSFRHFFFSYLTAYLFYLSVSLGALFFVALQHASRAGWSVTVRRLAEILAATLPLCAVLFLPILVPLLLGSTSLYPWLDPQLVVGDALLQHKRPFLNLPVYAAGAVACFLIWSWLARFYLRRSLEQDASGDAALTLRMERLSPVALLLLAVTVTFASFDWMMSLTPHWFSTMYGVYYFSGAVVGSLAVIVLMAVALQASGHLRQAITTEHYHDLGKLLLSFVIFWGYIAFSQYMLIWYANLPEETEWYRPRHAGPWGMTSLVLLFVHLLIPFLGLLPRAMKRRKLLLAFWALWLLAAHWLDVYWLVMPTFQPAYPPLGLLDLACLVGLGALYAAGVLQVARDRPLVAIGDPRLAEALAFENN